MDREINKMLETHLTNNVTEHNDDEQTVRHALHGYCTDNPDWLTDALAALDRLVARAQGQDDAIAELLAKNAALTESLTATSDALVAAERERDEWRVEAGMSKWPKDAAQEYHRMKVDLPAAEAVFERAAKILLEINAILEVGNDYDYLLLNDIYKWQESARSVINDLEKISSEDKKECKHQNQVFDRSICSCGWMHTYCIDCGDQLEPCEEKQQLNETRMCCGDPGDCNENC